MPDEYYCSETDDHKHVIDFHSITQADASCEGMIMDVTCKACGTSGAFRVPEVSEIDW